MRRILAALLAVLVPTAAPAADPAVLRIVAIDVEGGASTLFVTPEGHSLLIDAGWPAGLGGRPPAPGAPAPPPVPSSAQRIVAAAKAAGLSRIDYLLLTHYHIDHIGGLPELMASFPIGAFIDHGPNREQSPVGAPPEQRAFAPATTYPAYVAAIAGKPHRVMRPGDVLRIDGLVVTAVDADRQVPAGPLLPGLGAGVGCAAAVADPDIGGEENPRSLGVVATWGKARILALGDTTWDMEAGLVCPRDLVGPVDLMIADNHGTANSGNPVLLDTVRPTVLVFDNGPGKGADGASLERAAAASYIKGVWQLHFATRSPDGNAPAPQIANLEGGPDAMHPLRIAVDRSGTVTVANPRTGTSIAYPRSAGR